MSPKYKLQTIVYILLFMTACICIALPTQAKEFPFINIINKIEKNWQKYDEDIQKELRYTLYNKLELAANQANKNTDIIYEISAYIALNYLNNNTLTQWKQDTHSWINNYELPITYIDSIVDVDTIRQKWLQQHNDLRASLGIDTLTLNPHLNYTARVRASYLSDELIPAWSTHRRSWVSWYYNYNGILKWFNEQGIFFPKQNGTLFSESVGYNYIKCNTDCTDKISTATQKTWNMFMKEQSYNGPHYRAMINPSFTKMGIDIQYNTSKSRYYIVLHYATDIQTELQLTYQN